MSDDAALAVLDVLADGALHSGEVLASQFGISRAALAKRVEKLREWGLQVPAQPGLGYQLAQPLERLDIRRVRAAFLQAQGDAKLSLELRVRTTSTNSDLMESTAENDPQMLFTEYQSGGRGRRGREWLAPFGSCLMGSIAYSFSSWPARLTTLPLAIAVALARVVDELGVPEVSIKWPNDLQIGASKLAGVLIEPRGEASGPCRVVVGVGLNWQLPAEFQLRLQRPVVGLLDGLQARKRPRPSRNAVAGRIAASLLLALGEFESSGFHCFAQEWRKRDLLAGRWVHIDGAEPFEGQAEGIDANGALLIATATGQRAVHAGEVSVKVAT